MKRNHSEAPAKATAAAAPPAKKAKEAEPAPAAPAAAVLVAPAPAPADVAPQAVIPAPPPPPPQEVRRNDFVIYPDQYSSFDPARIVFSKDPVPSREGGGQMIYMSYIYEEASAPAGPDGTKPTKTKPLLIQTPNSIYAPAGVHTWKDGKMSMLLSAGRDWEANPVMVAFKALMDSIGERCAEATVEKGWGGDVHPDLDSVRDQYTPIMFISCGEKGEAYPPSIKASVLTTGGSACKTEFFEYSARPPLPPMVAADVVGGSSVTAILHLAWVYRKKGKRGFDFSVRVNLFQAVVELANSGTAIQRDGCAVVI